MFRGKTFSALLQFELCNTGENVLQEIMAKEKYVQTERKLITRNLTIKVMNV